MFLQRITTEGLAHHSYFLASGGEAIVVDPRRDVDVYLELARQHQVNLRAVLETHRNEDYVVGSCELAARTGARVLHGRGVPFAYGEFVEDGEELAVGSLRLRALATPGHTAESMTYALVDTASGEDAVLAFTGDALFVGEVGRTDLYGGDRREELAGWLYDSIFQRILPLGDTPRWYLRAGRRPEAEAALARVHRGPVAEEMDRLEADLAADSRQASWDEVFSARWRRPPSRRYAAAGCASFPTGG